jgi:DNA-binding response OmpR family regulator
VSRILVVEDEPRIASFLQKGLRAEGHVTTVVDNGDDASAVARSEDFDLVLLDVGLPGKDGFAVLADLRRRGERLPVILLTARDSVADRVNGLDAGADDYVTKPFSFEELRARVRVRLRESSDDDPTTLAAGRVRLDLLSRTATVDERTVELTAQEFGLAEVLLRHPQQVLSREQLLSQVWGYDYDPGSNIVDVYVGYLRRKLGTGVIETVRGVGYRLHG